jgi:hypothetical protein
MTELLENAFLLNLAKPLKILSEKKVINSCHLQKQGKNKDYILKDLRQKITAFAIWLWL